MDIHELGKAVQSARLNRGFSQQTLSAMASIARPTLSKLENGKAPEMGLNTVMRLCQILGMELTLVFAHKRPTLKTLVEERNGEMPLQATARKRVRQRHPTASTEERSE